MAKQGTLLVVDDNRNILTSLQYLLEEYFQQVITLNSPVTIPFLPCYRGKRLMWCCWT